MFDIWLYYLYPALTIHGPDGTKGVMQSQDQRV